MISLTRRPFALIVAGLSGMAFYTIATRPGLPTGPSMDAVHGAWLGVCLGLEVVGLLLLRMARRERARVRAGTAFRDHH